MSEGNCDNNCVQPLRFPRRPGEKVPSAHKAGCPCCAPEGRISSDNRPGLAHFNYRIGTYATIREWLFHQVNRAPALKAWTHRAPDDPAVALLEGASILGDILAFYQETYANEAFLRTAQWRESIANLVRLLGYRLSPAIGGNAVFAFELKKHEPVTIPVGFPLQATLETFASPSIFETKEAITAYPWLNRFHLYKPLVSGDITPSTTEFSIIYPEQLLAPIDLKVGDRILVGDADIVALFGAGFLANSEIVIVAAISELHGRKTYKIKGNLRRISNAGALFAFRLGRTFHHFGHNGPAQIVDKSKPVTSTSTTTAESGSSPAKTESTSTIPYLNVPFTRPMKTDSGAFSNPAITPSIGHSEFPLDSEVQDIPGNSPVIIQARIALPGQYDISEYSDFQTMIRSVKRIDSGARTWGGITGTVSTVGLSGPLSDSIGTLGLNLEPAALTVADNAEHDAASAFSAAQAARNAADNAKSEAARAITAAAAADADKASKTAAAALANSKADTLAVAAAIAASALKDDATDAATQAALDAATEALSAASTAKSDGETTADSVKDAADKAKTANDVAVLNFGITAGVATATAIALPPVGDALLNAAVVADGLVAVEILNAKHAADAAKREADNSKAASETAYTKVEHAEELALAARNAAKADADAKQRWIAADGAATLAKGKAEEAIRTLEQAERYAVDAHWYAEQSALFASGQAALADEAEENYAAALRYAEVTEAAKWTRMYIGDAVLHEVTSPIFTFVRAKMETTAAAGNLLHFYGTADEVNTLKSRRILLEKAGAASKVSTVVNVDAASASGTQAIPQLHEISLLETVDYSDFPNVNPMVTVFGNLADADEGKSLPEAVLGSGDATKIFQNFKLPKGPLTYHIIPENTPPETPGMEVYVDGQIWNRVETFFGHGPKEHIYIVREDAAGAAWVQFGDGKTGARLANGKDNVTVIHRLGAGSYGPLKAETKVQAQAKLKNLDKVAMPQPASGGAPPEDGESARHAAPGKVQSLGRIVSLSDFEAEAAAIPGVSLASAAWQLVDNIPAVVVTVLMETGRSGEINAVRDVLTAYNTQRGAGRTSIEVEAGKRKYVTVSVQYALVQGFRADKVEPEIRRALGSNHASPTGEENERGLFSMRMRRFGTSEYAASIEGMVQNVPGVLFAKAVAFTQLGDSDAPADMALPTLNILEPAVTCDSGHILSLYDGHLFLTAVKPQGQ